MQYAYVYGHVPISRHIRDKLAATKIKIDLHIPPCSLLAACHTLRKNGWPWQRLCGEVQKEAQKKCVAMGSAIILHFHLFEYLHASKRPAWASSDQFTCIMDVADEEKRSKEEDSAHRASHAYNVCS